MPLYEYACRDCDREFEALVRSTDTPSCPSCNGTHLERRLSVFAAHTQGGSGSSVGELAAEAGCGRCGDPRGPGACSLN